MTDRLPEITTQQWHLYMIRTKWGTLYTGIAQDVARRLLEHQEGGKKAAKYWQQIFSSKGRKLTQKITQTEKRKFDKKCGQAESGFPNTGNYSWINLFLKS